MADDTPEKFVAPGGPLEAGIDEQSLHPEAARRNARLTTFIDAFVLSGRYDLNELLALTEDHGIPREETLTDYVLTGKKG